jgi:death-on-curing protein
MESLLQNHPFVDGNKRTAVTVCGIFLARNGNPLTASPGELEDFALSVVIDHFDIENIARWLEAHTG